MDGAPAFGKRRPCAPVPVPLGPDDVNVVIVRLILFPIRATLRVRRLAPRRLVVRLVNVRAKRLG